MTIYNRRDLAPPRRRRRGRGRRVLVVVLVLAVLGGAAYAGWRLTRPSSPTRVAANRRCHTPAAAPVPVAPGRVRVRVLNTTLRTGLAARVRATLRRRGFRVVGVGNASPVVRGVVIRYPGGAGTPNGAVVTLREQFPGAVVRPGGRRGSYEVDLGRGFGKVASAAAAARERAADDRQAHPAPVCTTGAA